jgi:2-hydroxychromene-2-carboxylate isomerase
MAAVIRAYAITYAACEDGCSGNHLVMTVDVTHYTDPGCPWAYSASPAFAVLRWRYGDQLDWRLVTIGLTESAEQYVRRGSTPARAATGYVRFRRRFGMPFGTTPRPRVVATARACRAIVATRLQAPALEVAAFRALQFGWFTAPLVMDEEDAIATALARVDGLDVAAVVAALDAPEVDEAYAADRAEARTAEGGPTHAQGKAAASDGPVRYTAPSLVFEAGGRRLEAGGFQPVQAYDVCLANLDPTLERTPPPDDPVEALAAFPEGLVTQEVAAVMTSGNDDPDRDAAERALIAAAAEGRAARIALGDDALWTAVAVREPVGS